MPTIFKVEPEVAQAGEHKDTARIPCRFDAEHSECGTSHDRDVNAARNILARSRHRPPVEGAVAAYVSRGDVEMVRFEIEVTR